MSLTKLVFRPGINRETTAYANEGGWYDCNLVRFRAGKPETIGGWTRYTRTPTLGTGRALMTWTTLDGTILSGLGTNQKYYIIQGSGLNDITPIREVTAAGAVTFAATTGSNILTVTDTANGVYLYDCVTFSGAASLGGVVTATILNHEHLVTRIVDVDTYEITLSVTANASDTGSGGAAVIGTYQINAGLDTSVYGTGWSTGPWSRGTWGSGYTTGFGLQLRLWSQANFGERLLFCPRGGALYLWDPGSGATPAYNTRGTLVSGTDVPSRINQIMVSDTSRITIAFGCNDYGAYDTTPQDPLLIRWSEQESYTGWTPAITNQAGSYRLSHGSEIVGALQTRQEIVVWTDASIYSMQYLGPPYVYGFTLLADNVSLVSPNAMATAAGAVYWMGVDKFYIYSGRVETLPCSVRQFIFNDINRDQEAQFNAGTNEGYSEVWWNYCSKNSTVVDRYVIFNYLDRCILAAMTSSVRLAPALAPALAA